MSNIITNKIVIIADFGWTEGNKSAPVRGHCASLSLRLVAVCSKIKIKRRWEGVGRAIEGVGGQRRERRYTVELHRRAFLPLSPLSFRATVYRPRDGPAVERER